MHVSVASVLGDVSPYVSSSSEGQAAPTSPSTRRAASDERKSASGVEGRQGADDIGDEESSDEEDGEEEEEEMDVPSEICLPVGVVLCKAGTTCFEAPLTAGR